MVVPAFEVLDLGVCNNGCCPKLDIFRSGWTEKNVRAIDIVKEVVAMVDLCKWVSKIYPVAQAAAVSIRGKGFLFDHNHKVVSVGGWAVCCQPVLIIFAENIRFNISSLPLPVNGVVFNK